MRGQLRVEGGRLIGNGAVAVSDVGMVRGCVRGDLRQLSAHVGGVGGGHAPSSYCRHRVREVWGHPGALGGCGKRGDERLLGDDPRGGEGAVVRRDQSHTGTVRKKGLAGENRESSRRIREERDVRVDEPGLFLDGLLSLLRPRADDSVYRAHGGNVVFVADVLL